ncbi:hypothetical protein KY346_01780 [Candidatus Woesearchaeota archaeon]|nr:hypothetical protein [Candidatus Woesearchaeota archaeon]
MASKTVLLLFIILLVAGCTSSPFSKVYSTTEESVPKSTIKEAEKALEQTQHKTINYQAQCQEKACSASTSDEFEEALILCELAVNRPGYIAYTWPVQYLQARTLLFLELNQEENATGLYKEYLQIIQNLDYAPTQEIYQKEYFDCMENTDAKECLRERFCI